MTSAKSSISHNILQMFWGQRLLIVFMGLTQTSNRISGSKYETESIRLSIIQPPKWRFLCLSKN